MNSLKALSILVILFMSLLLFAQENTSTIKVDAEEAKKTADRFHVTVSVGGSSNLYKEDSLDREAQTTLDLIPSVYLGQGFTLSSRAIVTKEETGARNTSVSNIRVALKKQGPQLARAWGTSFTVAGVAPTNEDSRKRDRLQGAGQLAVGVAGQVSIVGIAYTLTGARNSHEYTVNAEGSPNIQYTLTNALDLNIELLKNWNLALSGFYRQGWTYNDFQRQTYGNEINLVHTVAKNWEISAGVSNEGRAFKANGTDSNIKVYDQNTTVVQAAVTFTN